MCESARGKGTREKGTGHANGDSDMTHHIPRWKVAWHADAAGRPEGHRPHLKLVGDGHEFGYSERVERDIVRLVFVLGVMWCGVTLATWWVDECKSLVYIGFRSIHLMTLTGG